MIKTIRLTSADANLLCNALGYATGAASREGDNTLRNTYIDLSDKVLVQLDGEAYTYGGNREKVVLALKEQGIEVV